MVIIAISRDEFLIIIIWKTSFPIKQNNDTVMSGIYDGLFFFFLLSPEVYAADFISLQTLVYDKLLKHMSITLV